MGIRTARSCASIAMILLLTGVMTGCGPLHPRAPQTSSEAETYAVYSALLEQTFSGSSGDAVVIRDHTTLGLNNEFPLTDSTRAYIKRNIPDLGADVLQAFQTANPSSRPLRNGFSGQIRVVVITKQESEALFAKGDWEEFYRQHPGANGIVTLSAVGFGDRMDQALVYAGRTTGRLAGEGYYILMVKKNGRWTVSHRAMAWIS